MSLKWLLSLKWLYQCAHAVGVPCGQAFNALPVVNHPCHACTRPHTTVVWTAISIALLINAPILESIAVVSALSPTTELITYYPDKNGKCLQNQKNAYKKRKMQITKNRKWKNALNKGSFFFFLFYMKKIEKRKNALNKGSFFICFFL
jgi:hypothetical protein